MAWILALAATTGVARAQQRPPASWPPGTPDQPPTAQPAPSGTAPFPGQPGQPGAQPAPAQPPGTAPPGYWPPPQGYPPPGYGTPPPGYGTPPPGYGWGPPPSYPSPPYGYDQFYPRTLPYREGEPVPPGYRVEEQARRGYVIAGLVTFGSLYLISVLTAATIVAGNEREMDEFGAMFVPVAGPFITIGTSSGEAPAAIPMLILDGLGQTAGAVLFIAGLTATQTLLVREDVARPAIHVGPGRATATWTF